MKDRQTIFLIDDDKVVLDCMSEMLQSSMIEKIDLYAFTNHEDFLSHPKLKESDLFIIDIKLDDVDGRDLCSKLQEDNTINIPCLFISGYPYNEESFTEMTHHCIYDYIQKPFNQDMFINRVRVLLKHASLYKQLHQHELDATQRLQKEVNEQTKLKEEARSLLKKVESAIWETFNYSNLYTVILDKTLTIRLANFALAKALGFDNENDLIGKKWIDFVKVNERIITTTSLKGICGKDLDYRETTCDIITSTGEHISVKWFNSYINDKFNGAFSIGVPLTKNITPEDNMDSIRSYYRDIVDKDRTMIQSIKKVAISNRDITNECK